MTINIKSETLQLNRLKLPALQTRYAEVVGQATRSPNRTYAEHSDMRSSSSEGTAG